MSETPRMSASSFAAKDAMGVEHQVVRLSDAQELERELNGFVKALETWCSPWWTCCVSRLKSASSGSVTERQMAWRETGLQLRRKRLDSNMTLRDFARASKIDLDPLQRMEIGAQDPTPLKEAHARIFNP